MATHLQVILKQDVDKLGAAGELVRVRPGFARNYLMPRGMAVVATGENVRQIEHERRIAVAISDKQKKFAEGAAAQIDGLTVEIPMQAGEGDKLFGSVTARDVEQALSRHGIDVDRKKLQLPPESIKTLGEHTITIKLGHEVTATFKVNVTAA
jgi:large subunit ribosomal protein L9